MPEKPSLFAPPTKPSLNVNLSQTDLLKPFSSLSYNLPTPQETFYQSSALIHSLSLSLRWW
jgi:hypothetical protein